MAEHALLYHGSDWSFDRLKRVYDACAEIGLGELGLDIYPNQIEVITAEQMLDAYASIGMPLLYRHWSFGKRFAREETLYRKGAQALAYELVINSSPCVSYVMEQNSMTMQTLVIAHAAFGHNHFFKNNYLFKQWTRADAILDYLEFAKTYVATCEERHGLEAVERVLDAAHALMSYGVNPYGRRRSDQSKGERRQRELDRLRYEEAVYDDLWRTVPGGQVSSGRKEEPMPEDDAALGLPEGSILYFLEKHAPRLEDWQRELIRIVRVVSQYFYPQRQTKMMNEGCATFVHYEIMNRLFDRGRITEGAMLEFLHSHSSVVTQPDYDDRRYSGINPYALGFAMMRDIQRIAERPTNEDETWFPNLAGTGDGLGALREAWADYRDESFILQYLSPKVIRDFKLFAVTDDAGKPVVGVDAIHDEQGYSKVRRRLARQYDIAFFQPEIAVTEANLTGNRRLVLEHRVRNGVLLDEESCEQVLGHVARLWGYRVKLVEVDDETGAVRKEHGGLPDPE